MNPPTRCDCCGSENVEQTQNDRVYGRLFGAWPEIYLCNDCGAYVGCHPRSLRPLGSMADEETRALRQKAHEAFDPIWKSGKMTRTEAYMWLAHSLKIETKYCHIAMLPINQLRTTIRISLIKAKTCAIL